MIIINITPSDIIKLIKIHKQALTYTTKIFPLRSKRKFLHFSNVNTRLIN